MKSQPKDKPTEKLHNPGIGGTLAWLEMREVEARKRVELAESRLPPLRARMLNKPIDDIPTEWKVELQSAELELEAANEHWGKLATNLRQIDPKVAPEKRDSGQKLEQAEAARILEMAVVHLRLGVEQCRLSLCQTVPLAGTNEQKADAMTRGKFDEALTNAIENAASERQLDKWVVDALRAGL